MSSGHLVCVIVEEVSAPREGFIVGKKPADLLVLLIVVGVSESREKRETESYLNVCTWNNLIIFWVLFWIF